MSSRRSTSYDVARLAGVSQSAVSRVFSPSGSASREMRDKILKAAKKLNYKPNAIAQSLSRGRTRIIGMIITHFSNQAYPVPLQATTDVLLETGESVLLQIVDPDDLGDEAVSRLLRYRVDAIICTSDLSNNAALICAEENVPLVLVNRRSNVPNVDHVASDNFESSEKIAAGLASINAENIGYIRGPENNWVAQMRYKGFLKGSRDAGLPVPVSAQGNFSYEGGYNALNRLVEKHGKFDAIVSANDPMAIGAMDAIVFKKNMRVPEDIMVIGHDDTPDARLKPYQLTSTRQPMQDMLKKAVELALQRLDNPELPSTDIVMASKLIMRRSAAW